MCKRKLLIQEIFREIQKNSDKDTKYGWAADLSDELEKKVKFSISTKTLSRYYDSFVTETREETGIDTLILNKLSEYLNCKDFVDFTRTFTKNEEDSNKTTVKISVDQDETSLATKLSNIIINISNEQHFKMPNFMKKNGMGLVEIAFLIVIATGSVVSSKKPQARGFAGFLQSGPHCMYWDKSEYKPVDCDDKNPQYGQILPFDYEMKEYFKRIERKDTLTVENALGKVWYSKYNGKVEFFTHHGTDPNNGRALRKATAFIIDKYANQPVDSQEDEN